MALTIKEFDPELQPREKALKYGIQSLSTSQLLALILRTGIPGLPITEMTECLMTQNGGSLHSLERCSLEEIMLIPGMGRVKAQQVQAIMQLAVRYFKESETFRPTLIRKSSDIYNDMRFHIGNLNHEEIWLLTLNRRHAIMRRHHLTSGGSSSSVFDLKQAIKRAILDEASSIVLCHNHPSGTLSPSPQDDSITRALHDAAKLMGITLIDHVIITAAGYYSYADEGRL